MRDGADARPLHGGEESPAQVRLRAERLGRGPPRDPGPRRDRASEGMSAGAGGRAPEVVIVDSIQTVSAALDDPPGHVTQVRECARAAIELAKAAGLRSWSSAT